MKTGDMVRFAKWGELSAEEIRNTKLWPKTAKPYVGILVSHDKLMSSCEVLYGGEVLKIRACFVEKAGRRDFETR